MILTDTRPAGATKRANRWHRHPEAFGKPLSKREEMILRLVSEGLTNRQIAYACGISEHTVRNHQLMHYRRGHVQDRSSEQGQSGCFVRAIGEGMNPWPVDLLAEAEHVMSEDGWCWCQPRKEDVLPFGELTIHRHFWDRPEYTEPEAE